MYKKQFRVEEKFTLLISIFKFLSILDQIIFKIIVVNNRLKYIFAHSLIKWSRVILILLLISIKASQIINRIQILK